MKSTRNLDLKIVEVNSQWLKVDCSGNPMSGKTPPPLYIIKGPLIRSARTTVTAGATSVSPLKL